MKRRPATTIHDADARWFRYTTHCLKTWAPTLAAQFVATFESGRRLHDRASYFAVLADLLAEASHWQGRGAVGPGRSTTSRASCIHARANGYVGRCAGCAVAPLTDSADVAGHDGAEPGPPDRA